MAIVFLCNGCGKRYEVDPSLAGKKAACKDCRTQFVIPSPTTARPKTTNSPGSINPSGSPIKHSTPPNPPPRPVAQPARPVAPPSSTAPAVSAADLFGLEDAPAAPLPRRGPQSSSRVKPQFKSMDRDDLADVPYKTGASPRSSGMGYFSKFSPRVLAIGLPAGTVAFAIAFAVAYKTMSGGINLGPTLGKIVGSITGETAHERLMKELLASLNELADLFERIQSPADIEPIRPRLTELQSRMEQFQQEFQTTPRPSAAEDIRLKAQYESDFKKAIARVNAQVSRLQSMPGFIGGFMPRLPQFPGFHPEPPFAPSIASPFPPGFPTPAPIPGRPLPTTPPPVPGDALKLIVKGISDDGHTEYVSEQINGILEDLPPVPQRFTSHYGDQNGKTWTISPVADPQGFADQIKFGRVESVVGKTIVVLANSMNEADRRPDESDAVARALFDLKSRDRNRRREALTHLAEAIPTSDRRSQVARAIEGMLDDKDSWNRQEAMKALAVWADDQSVAALIAHTNDSDHFVQESVVNALGKCKDVRAADAIIPLFDKHRGPAHDALVSIGPMAEAATLKLLRHQDIFVRAEGCKVLKEIGTSKSLPLLQEMSRRQGLDADAAREAIRVIKTAHPTQSSTPKPAKASEPSTPGSTPAPTSPEQPSAPAPRPKSSLPKGKRLSG